MDIVCITFRSFSIQVSSFEPGNESIFYVHYLENTMQLLLAHEKSQV